MKYYTGRKLTVLLAEKTNGNCPAKDYLDGLDNDKFSALDRIIHRLADFGKIFNKEQFRIIEDQIYEIKAKGHRLPVIFKPNCFIITHGFPKRGGGRSANKFPPREKTKALGIISEYEGDPLQRDLGPINNQGG